MTESVGKIEMRPTMKKAYATIFSLMLLLGLSACGQKGPLVLPPEPAPQEEPAKTDS